MTMEWKLGYTIYVAGLTDGRWAVFSHASLGAAGIVE